MNDAGESASGDTVAVGSAAAKPRKRIGLAIIGGALLLGLLWLGLRGGDPGKAGGGAKGPGPAAVPVIVASAERRDVPVYLAGLGTITAFNTVTVRTRVDGQIVQVAFREGQEVHKGDLLLVIDPRPFEVQLSQAQAALARDQAQLADARLNLERDRDLLAQGILPQQQMDSQRALVQQLEGSGQVDQSQIDNARLQLIYCRITAPVGGRVGLRLVDEGNVVRAADTNGLLVITQLEPITVLFTLPEDSLPAVARHMKDGPLPVDAYSRDDQTKLASGNLLTIDNQIDSSTGTGRLKAVFENRDRTLWPNQFVNVRLLLEVRKAQVVVPAAAVQRGSQGVFAYVVKPDKTIEVHLLKVGLTQGGIAAIDDGLAPGDQVVTDGHEKVQAGTRVEPRAGGGKPAAGS
ncbi:MAG TPA: MdtA/MuxA family multidrug efflux RND transporter periplasmic adaptor subunit [Vicinamibacteria bacterium]|jgi:multidrug efflux system membrane fusion protein|nr:MdtA/MuxA family multidrug efflux RND transporter periplasmic adaptor subunit [Vicinamibacteria bacterium]